MTGDSRSEVETIEFSPSLNAKSLAVLFENSLMLLLLELHIYRFYEFELPDELCNRQ